MKATFFFVFVIGLPLSIVAQIVDSFAIAFEQQYAINIMKEEINGVYIPVDVADALLELDRFGTDESRNKIRQGEEEIVATRLSRGLGKWMIVNWNFEEGSRLSHHLKKMGVSHPDDMALFLVVSYYRYLKGVDLELTKRAEEQRKNREKIYRESKKVRIVSVVDN